MGKQNVCNRTLLGMLGTLDCDKKSNWPDYVASLVHAYNCTKHASTGYAPYFLMYGRSPRLPIDVTLGLPTKTEDTRPYAAYAENLRARLAHAYRLASRGSGAKAAANKRQYDAKARDATLQPGDRVLARNLSNRGKHKVQDRWEDIPYIVLRRAGELPVYVIQQEGGDKRRRTLHRNLLLPYELPSQQHQGRKKHTHPRTIDTLSDVVSESDKEEGHKEEGDLYTLSGERRKPC